MANNPYELVTTDKILFIIDAEHSVEEKYLSEWIDKLRAESGFTGQESRCVLSIAANPENIDVKGFDKALDVDPNTLVAPVRILWKSSLDEMNESPRLADMLKGNPRRPSRAQARRIIADDATKAICIAGKPATLADLIERFEERRRNAFVDKDLSHYVAGQAGLALEVAERRLRGSRYKIPRQVANQIRSSYRYKQGIQKLSEESGETEEQLRERARVYFSELVAVPHNFWQDVMGGFNRWVISLGYEDKLVMDKKRLMRFRKIVQEHPSAILWTHKTHMDGLTMQAVLFENDFPTPHTMGGINMAFAGMGFLARSAGAIFIRRSFQDNNLYKFVLRQYLAYLLDKRFPLTWSFEGTRSRVGKLMPPRYGMLKYVLDAMEESSQDNLHIIPVAINYDMINDVKDYAAEQSGAIKRPESLSWFVSYLRGFKQPLGRIYLDFGEPVIVSKADVQNDELALQKIAFKVGVEANRVTPITLTALMSMSLLGASPRAQTIGELQDNMDVLRTWAEHRDVKFTSDFEEGNREHMLEIINHMIDSKLIRRYDEGPETVYAVAPDQHAEASYYRNTIVHHFVTKALTELALMEAANATENSIDVFWKEADRLRDMFKFEFFYSPTEEFRADVKAELAFFDKSWEKKLEKRTSTSDLLKNFTPIVAHASLKPYIEAYRIVADVFARLPDTETLNEKAMLTASFRYGRQAYLQRRITSKASLGQILFKNGYKLLDSYGLVAPSEGVAEKRKKFSQDLRKLAHRLEQIRVLAMPHDFD
jgi:glycerol-3-phosphate O-acyltransferase